MSHRNHELHAGLSVREGELVERVIQQLNLLCKTVTFEFALSVGKLIIDAFYDGDLERWQMRAPKVEISLRKLVKHPDLPMSPGALWRSVAMYELTERLGIRSWKHVSTSHLRLVLPCAPEEQRRLLLAAEQHMWTVQQLDDQIVSLVRDRSRIRGRKRHSRARKAVTAVKKCLVALRETLDATVDDVSDRSPDSAREVLSSLEELAAACERHRAHIREHMPVTTSEWPAPLETESESSRTRGGVSIWNHR
jgi:hypothetical protein